MREPLPPSHDPFPPRLRLSSRLTRWYKQLFPLFCLGLPLIWLTAFFWGVRGGVVEGGPQVEAMGLGVAGFAAGLGALLWQKFSLSPVDEVWLEGATLLVRKKGVEARIPLRNIVKMTPSRLLNPKRLTITLREASPLGQSIVFILPGQKSQPELETFVERLNQAHAA